MDLVALDGASTDTLTQLCDDYQRSLLDNDFEQRMIRDSRAHRRALEILASRGSEILLWARARLQHPEYDARQDGAWLIMQLAKSQQLGPDERAIGDELVALAVRPPVQDTKEAEAASMALIALSIIGGAACMKDVRAVLTSADWDQDDNQWNAAEILAGITGEPFMEADDPVSAAKEWLKSNPTAEV